MPARSSFIIFGRSTDWVVPLRLALGRGRSDPAERQESDFARPLVAGLDYRLIETRTPDDCLAALARESRALVGIELTAANADRALALIRTVAEQFSGARIVVLAAREMADHEGLARELGAAGFVTSPRHLDEFLLIARRHWGSLPQPDLGAAESAWATLPWK